MFLDLIISNRFGFKLKLKFRHANIYIYKKLFLDIGGSIRVKMVVMWWPVVFSLHISSSLGINNAYK
jgi:hypothetical protein